MKRVFFLIAALLLVAGPASSGSLTLLGAGGGGGVSYLGPLDASLNGAGFAFWSTRCGSAAYTGSVIDIIDTATGLTGTRLACSTGGVLAAIVSASACTFVTSTSCSPLATTCASACSAEEIYDQTGTACSSAACNIVQKTATVAKMPTVTLNCQNGKICLTFTAASSQCLNSGYATSSASLFTLSTVYNMTSATILQFVWASYNAVDFGTTGGVPNSITLNATLSATAADATIHSVQSLFNSASSSIYIGGTTTSGNAGTTVLSGYDLDIGGVSTCGGYFFGGEWFETGLWLADKTANNAAVTSNQSAYWGF
jgi:hypothetical protein